MPEHVMGVIEAKFFNDARHGGDCRVADTAKVQLFRH